MVKTKGNQVDCVKIIDFGHAKFLKRNERSERMELDASQGGTFQYCPPEKLAYEMVEDPSVDFWALGLIIYFVLVGEHPFCDLRKEEEDLEEIAQRIENDNIVFPEFVSQEARHLISKLTHKDRSSRMNCVQVLQHKWLK